MSKFHKGIEGDNAKMKKKQSGKILSKENNKSVSPLNKLSEEKNSLIKELESKTKYFLDKSKYVKTEIISSFLKENLIETLVNSSNNESKNKLSIVLPRNGNYFKQLNNNQINSEQVVQTFINNSSSTSTKFTNNKKNILKSTKTTIELPKNKLNTKQLRLNSHISKPLETTKLQARKSLKDYTSLNINDPGMKISIDLSKNKNISNDVSKEKSELSFTRKLSTNSFSYENKRSLDSNISQFSRNLLGKNDKLYSTNTIKENKFMFDENSSMKGNKLRISPLVNQINLDCNNDSNVSPFVSNRTIGAKEKLNSPILKIKNESLKDGDKLKEGTPQNQLKTLNTLRVQMQNKNIALSIDGTKINRGNVEKTKIANNEKITDKLKMGKAIKKIHYVSKTGYSGFGSIKINQDTCYIRKKFIDDNTVLFGVSDGHGVLGHEVARFLQVNMPNHLESEIKSKINSLNFNLKKIISEVYNSLNAKLFADSSIDSHFSGSTCLTVIYKPEKLICSNVGDSRAIVGRYSHNSKCCGVEILSNDHKPHNLEEKLRIRGKNGRVEPYKDENGTFIGPNRVWLKDKNIPGLAMSRSFGDKIGASVGIISEPEIIEYNINQDDLFFILASDGLWEFMDNNEVVKIINEYYLKDNIEGAAKSLINEATRKWMKEEEIIDDITLILVFLE